MKHAKLLIVFRWFLIVAYICCILTKTIIGRPVQPAPVFKPLFWEIQNEYWEDIVLNILLFIPIGFLIGGWKGLLTGFILSVAIEATQYIKCLGYCEMDDILNNVIGTGIGVIIKLYFKCYIEGKKRK